MDIVSIIIGFAIGVITVGLAIELGTRKTNRSQPNSRHTKSWNISEIGLDCLWSSEYNTRRYRRVASISQNTMCSDCGCVKPLHSSTVVARDSIAKQALADLGESCYNPLGFSES